MCKNSQKREFMKNRIFYGEYTLKHWIKLMRKYPVKAVLCA